MNLAIFVIATLFLIRAVTTFGFLLQSLSWLKRNRFEFQIVNKDITRPQIHILIPALREQRRILETLDYFIKYFLNKNVKIIVVTSQREFDKPFLGPSTYELVSTFIRNKRLVHIISVIDYPNKEGAKADQLNYALHHIDDSDIGFIAVYDADSRPHPRTLEIFYQIRAQNPSVKIFQQSAIFLKNYDKLPTLFLKPPAILQSRWTLSHEIPRLLRQAVSGNEFFKRFAYAHVVGHGLIIDTSTLKQLGGFPSGTLTEDLFLGYLIRTKGYAIYPLPVTELADSPTTIRGLWNQKYVWFFGPLKMVTYLRYVLRRKDELGLTDIKTPIMMTVQGIITTLAWLSSGPLVLVLILYPLITANAILIVYSWTSIFLYGPLQYLVMLMFYRDLHRYAGAEAERRPFWEIILVPLMSIPAVIFNSLPPWFALFDNFYSSLRKKPIEKPKTDD